MITTTRDMFSIQGARETAGEISRIYEAYGKKENFSMVEDDAPHASTKKNREAMYSFFQKNLGAPGNPDDSDETLLTEAEMKVTPTGQVSTSLGGETVFSLNRKEAEKLADKLKISRNELRQHLAGVLASAKKLSGYQAPEMPEGAVFNGRVQAQGYVIEKYFLKGEGDYVIPYLLMVPDKSSGKSLIYLHPSGKAGGDSARAEMEWFVTKGFTVLAPDLVGIGETGSGDFQGDSFIGGMSHNLWYSSILIGRSIVGIRAGDVVRLTRLLQKQSTASEIYALARNEMSPVLLHAAAFDPTIGRVAIINSYASYRSLVTNRFYNSSFIHNAVPGVLQAYDLPDLAACLAPRKLLMAGLTDALGKPLTADAVEDLSIISAAFKNNNSADQLKVVLEVSDGKLTDLMTEWIK
jgi:hypothetical protein